MKIDALLDSISLLTMASIFLSFYFFGFGSLGLINFFSIYSSFLAKFLLLPLVL